MSLNIEKLKKQIIYRSSYRGTKEMEMLLCSFVKSIVDNLDEKDLENLLNLLNLDDEDIHKFKQEKKFNINIGENKITKLFKNYVYKK